jgi:hypothetical protein
MMDSTRSMPNVPLGLAIGLILTTGSACVSSERLLWTPEQATAWYAKQPWMVGANYLPRDAINQLEMWQAETFDAPMIDQEFNWAEGLGINTMRVFLHDIPWHTDHIGFLKRIEQYLAIADRHHIRTIFVLFDSCWNAYPKAGPQPAPRPHVHNSGWVQAPGTEILSNPARYDELKGYVTGVIGQFRDDPRVVLWDLFNEMDNGSGDKDFDKPARARDLGSKALSWALACNPIQPVTFCIWQHQGTPYAQLSASERFEIDHSDIITFHSYAGVAETTAMVAELSTHHRPLMCTEYMARTIGCTIAALLPYYHDHNIAAINWGFVDGKSQTKFPWDSWSKPYPDDPPVWFHDILRPDGSPFDPKEATLLRTLTGHLPAP